VKFSKVLYEPGKAIRYVYFPIDCLISLLTAVDKRRTLEVGMVGNEGMAGIPFILGMGISGVRALVQAVALNCEWPFRVEFDRIPALPQALYRYTHAFAVVGEPSSSAHPVVTAVGAMTRPAVATANTKIDSRFMRVFLRQKRSDGCRRVCPADCACHSGRASTS
jgi:hypothetical protein